MKKARDIESLIIDELFDECSSSDKAELDSILENDSARREEFNSIKETMDVVSRELKVNDPGEEYWDNVWDTFRNRVLVEEREAKPSLFRFDQMAWVQFWKPALQIGVVAIMLVLGIFIGKQLSGVSAPAEGDPDSTYSDITYPYQEEIARKKNEYMLGVADSSLNESRDIIDSFMEVNPDQSISDIDRFTQQQDKMGRILEDLTLLRASSDDIQLQRYSNLFDELEIVLGEIATLKGDPMQLQYEVRSLQEGIRELNLRERLKEVRFQTVNDRR